MSMKKPMSPKNQEQPSAKPEQSPGKNAVKHTVKDSVFRDLFGKTKYLLRLYQALHPEDTGVTEADLRIVTLKNIFLNQMYNDLGFTVGSKSVILLEAQSTWSLNIAVRALLYLAKTWQEFIQSKDLNPYSSTILPLPKPEVYMIYTGNRHVEHEDISLNRDIFAGESEFLELKVKVIYNSDKKNIISEYIIFTKVYDEQIKKYGPTPKAVLETIRICREAGILAEYLQEREKEVTDIMITLFDDDYLQEAWGKELKAEAKEEGLREGEAIGLRKGEAIGREQGLRDGKAIGREQGEQQAQRNTTMNMLKGGYPDQEIYKMTGISPALLQECKAAMQAGV